MLQKVFVSIQSIDPLYAKIIVLNLMYNGVTFCAQNFQKKDFLKKFRAYRPTKKDTDKKYSQTLFASS